MPVSALCLGSSAIPHWLVLPHAIRRCLCQALLGAGLSSKIELRTETSATTK